MTFAAISSSDGYATPLQRARGRLSLAFAARNGATHVARNFQEGALKVRFPKRLRTDPCEAVFINASGGLTGGDRLDIDVEIGSGASALLTSQACERIYRSTGDMARIRTQIKLRETAICEYLPQPSLLFEGGRLHREIDVDLAQDASLLALESVVFGREAMNETVATGALIDGWSIKRGGRLLYADRTRLTGDLGSLLARESVLGGHRCLASLLYVAPDAESKIDDMRSTFAGLPAVAAASAWDGMLAARLVSRDYYALMQSLRAVLDGIRQKPLPRVWTI